jgi:GNAT superfamily N-acetyltransferase
VHGVSHLSSEDVGARVTVRRRGPDGALRDVVGDLESLDDAGLAIRRRDGALAQVRAEEIVTAHVVGPSPRDALELEAISGRGWPAIENEWLGQWWLRASGGFTARANSVRALGTPGVALDTALDRVTSWYAARDLPPRVRVVAKASADLELGRRGWSTSCETALMTATLARVSARLDEKGFTRGTTIGDQPSSGWLGLFRDGRPSPMALSVLTGAAPIAFATLLDDVGTAAIGRAAVEDRWAGLTAIEVRPDVRRRGYARGVIAALADWAKTLGATRAYLEVLVGNDPAFALYESLGFAEHHRYRYREP